MALGEIAGVENRGLSVDEISSSLRPYKSESVECKTGIDRWVKEDSFFFLLTTQSKFSPSHCEFISLYFFTNIQMCRCVICQVEFEGGEMLVALPCDHPYHSDCISKWLQIGKVTYFFSFVCLFFFPLKEVNKTRYVGLYRISNFLITRYIINLLGNHSVVW